MKINHLRRTIALILAAVMIFSLAACKKADSQTDSTSNDTPSAEMPANAPVTLVARSEYDVDKYVQLGQYKGVEAAYVLEPVTDEDVADEVNAFLTSIGAEKQVTDRAVEMGDTVNIDYEGIRDGVPFDGGTAQDQPLTIGSNYFIEGFEEGLVGVMPGESVTLDLVFPDDSRNEELAGAAVVFNVTVNYISETELPEYNDELIVANTEYATVAEFEAGVRTQLETERKQAADDQMNYEVWAAISESSTITAYPLEDYNSYIESARSYYEQVSAMYSITFEEFLSYNSLTLDEYNEMMANQAVEYMALYIVLAEAIAKKEGIEATQAEFDAYLADELVASGFTNEEEFTSYYGTNLVEALGGETTVWVYVLYGKVNKLVMDSAVIQ